MTTTRTRLTAEELLFLPDDGLRHELVGGELRSAPFHGAEHGVVAATLGAIVSVFVDSYNLGSVVGNGTGFQIAWAPDSVRAPDVGFVSQDRIALHGIPEGFWPGAPDLAAEVVSPGDTYGEVDEKVLQWLRAGTRLVWVVNPRSRTVAAHEAAVGIRILSESDSLTGGGVLAGFECRVSALFP